jgi:exonuclease SbcC
MTDMDYNKNISELKKEIEINTSFLYFPENCNNNECKFFKKSVLAKDNLEELSIKLKEQQAIKDKTDAKKRAEIEILKQKLSKIKKFGKKQAEGKTKIEKELGLFSEKYNAYKSENKQIDIRIKHLQSQYSNKQKEIDSIEKELKNYDQTKIELAQIELKRLEKEKIKLMDSEQEQTDEYEKKIKEFNSLVSHIELRIEKIPEIINLSPQIEEVGQKKQESKNNIKNIDNKIINLNSDLKFVTKQIEEIKNKIAEKDIIKQKIDALKTEVSRWEWIRIQTGKKGLQAIEIDNAVPLIQEYTNSLLTNSYGSKFSVKIMTQDLEAGKEIFEIFVIRDDGSESKFGNCSGGQKIFLLKAIRLAMTLVSKQKSGNIFETALSDEEDSALDSENAEKFMELYRSFMDVGDFSSKIFISHRSESVEMADYQIKFNKNGVEII